MCTTGKAVLFDLVWPSERQAWWTQCVSQKGSRIAGRTGLANSMPFAERSSFINSLSIVEKMNLIGFLDSTRIAAAMIIYPHFAISVSRLPITRLESNVFLFSWLFKLRSDDFRNIRSLNNVTSQYLRTGRSSGLKPGRSLCRLA